MVKGPAPFDQGIFLMHLGKGKEYFEKADFQKAREELEAAYHLRPQDEKVLNMLGMTYFKMEMLPQAEEMYVALSANNPDIYTLQSNLGLIRLKLDKFDQAETALTRALELQPANPKAHFYLGLLYEKIQNWEKALFHFEYAKADKMVAKAKEKLAEQRAKESKVKEGALLLPFEVLEVLEDEEVEQDPGHTVLAPEGLAPPPLPPSHDEEALRITDDEMAAAEKSEWVEHGGSTGKMRRKDVLEAMQKLEEKEAEDEGEELVEDSEAPLVEEEEENPWEKTQPTIVAEAPAAGEVTEEPAPQEIPANAQQPPSPSPQQAPTSFFITEDAAADISTFLAQTQVDGSREEVPDYVAEPPGMDVPAVEQPAEEPVETVARAASEARIPTPEEVENTTMDFGREAIFSSDEEAPLPIPKLPEEEVEELREDAAIEGSPSGHPVAEPGDGAPVEAAGGEGLLTVNEEEKVEHTIPMQSKFKPEVPASQSSRDHSMVEAHQPANLDQFSRDRFYIQPLIGADRFLLIDPHLLEIIISDRMIVRKGTISSYTGSVGFTPWANEEMPLVEISGSGILFLADRRKEIFIISLNNESIFVESNHLLVAQSVLKMEPYSLQHGDDVFSTLKISGRGTIAITCQTKPLTLNVYDAMPANIPAEALIAWSGHLATEVVADSALYSVMMQPDEPGALLRFSGNGNVVVEQGALWGDRRMKK